MGELSGSLPVVERTITVNLNLALFWLGLTSYLAKISRAGGIRTHDLLNPIQAFYQAELRPDLKLRICANSGDWPQMNMHFSGIRLRFSANARH
jgi:hypothetical protein